MTTSPQWPAAGGSCRRRGHPPCFVCVVSATTPIGLRPAGLLRRLPEGGGRLDCGRMQRMTLSPGGCSTYSTVPVPPCSISRSRHLAWPATTPDNNKKTSNGCRFSVLRISPGFPIDTPSRLRRWWNGFNMGSKGSISRGTKTEFSDFSRSDEMRKRSNSCS